MADRSGNSFKDQGKSTDVRMSNIIAAKGERAARPPRGGGEAR